MFIQNVIAAIDEEISKLQQARQLLGGEPESELTSKQRGRPKGSRNNAQKTNESVPTSAKRGMSAEGKARIAAAQKKRWADKKNESSAITKTAKKSASASSKASSSVAPKRAYAKKNLAGKAPVKKSLPARKTKTAKASGEVPTQATEIASA